MTNETLMTTPAATTPEGGAASPPAVEQPATGAGEGGQSQPATPEQASQGQPADSAKLATEPKPQGAPESYEFKAAEGQTFDDEVINAFSGVAKELNLPQDQAQKVLDTMAPVLQARQAEQVSAARQAWADSSKADKEFGGDQLTENLATAKKAMDAFASPELRTLLDESGLGNHPEVIRLFVRAGKAISEDRFVAGKATAANPGDARRLYAASNMNP